MPIKPSTPKTTNKTGGPRAAARADKLRLVPGAAVPPVDGAGDGDDVAKGRAASGLRLKELVERVVAATGGKRKGVKEVVEATLLLMGEALHRGESLNLPAFGKLRVARAGTEGGGAMTLKLRQTTGGGARANSGKESLADAEDQD